MPQVQKVHLRAEARQLRDGKVVFRGDPFTASPEEAADLVSMSFASVVDHGIDKEPELPPVVSSKPTIRRKVLTPGKAPTKGTYRRRDLRSDD
jgi:hypothetical protein